MNVWPEQKKLSDPWIEELKRLHFDLHYFGLSSWWFVCTVHRTSLQGQSTIMPMKAPIIVCNPSISKSIQCITLFLTFQFSRQLDGQKFRYWKRMEVLNKLWRGTVEYTVVSETVLSLIFIYAQYPYLLVKAGWFDPPQTCRLPTFQLTSLPTKIPSLAHTSRQSILLLLASYLQ